MDVKSMADIETTGEILPFRAETQPGVPQPPRILSIANQKGGVGKTTTAINLGTALAAIGERVLIIDLDPQGNASTGLGIDKKSRENSTYDVITGAKPLRQAILATAVPHLHIAPSTMDLTGFELEVGQTRDRAFRLRNALAALNEARPGVVDFTYVLVDCPHSLNPELTIHGIVLTMYDARNNLSGQVVADVREFMGPKVYDTIIPRNVRVSEAPSYGKPVLVYDLKCVGSEAYLRLATEIIQREKQLKELRAS